MSGVPRKPRPIARSSGLTPDVIAGRPVVRRRDARQAELFAFPFVPPCKPTLRDKLPTGDRWQYEIKHDGYRIQAHLDRDEVRLFTKSGLDYADRLPGIVAALRELPVMSAVIDGEAVMEDADGVTDFFALHAALSAKRAPEAGLIAFDLIELAGEDIREKPLAERRAMLAEILIGATPGVELSPHMTGDGEGLLRAVCERGLEGVIAKRVDAPYRSGRVETWLKVKCTRVEAFAVIGFDPEGSRGVASLKIACLDGERLTPCGSVGSGLTRETAAELRRVLDAGGHVVVDVEYRGRSRAGELRHPVFKGWHREP